jgi:hypothetical protein
MPRILDYSARRIDIIPRTVDYLEKYISFDCFKNYCLGAAAGEPADGVSAAMVPVRTRVRKVGRWTDAFLPGRFANFLDSRESSLATSRPTQKTRRTTPWDENLVGEKSGRGKGIFCLRLLPSFGWSRPRNPFAIISQQQDTNN